MKFFDGSRKILVLAWALLALVFLACEQNEKTGEPAPEMSLNEAALTGNQEVVNQHIKAGSDLNEKDPFGGSTPLITASVFGKTEIVKILIDAGADLNAKNKDGSTALHAASFFCRTEIVKALLNAGADKSIRNSFGSTALEGVSADFKDVKNIYELMGTQLKGFGLQLDMERIEKTRPEIAALLK